MSLLPTIDRLHQLLVCDAELGVIKWRDASDRWGRRPPMSVAGYFHRRSGYMRVRIDNRHHPIHRVIFAMHSGRWPDDDIEIDHINGDRIDNRISNLREATTSGNQLNRQGCNSNKRSTDLIGAFRYKKRWRASIRVDRKLNHLGVFDTPEEAHAAYVAAKQEVARRVLP